jgi:hypothetical protein
MNPIKLLMMKQYNFKTILFIIIPLCLSMLLISSCSEKSMEGMMILTQVDSKVQPNDLAADHLPARLVAVNPANSEGSLKLLTEDFYSAHSPEISCDGTSLLFTAKKSEPDAWQVFEMNLINFNVKQVTSAGNNFNPIHLPNGRFIYGSAVGQEDGKTGRPLFTCNPDGSDPLQITFSPIIYQALTVLKDGRVLALDKTTSEAKNKNILMVMRPDGTKAELFYLGAEGSRLVGGVTETNDGKIVFVEKAENTSNITCISYNRPLHSRVNLSSEIKGDFQSVFPLTSGKLLVSYRTSETERYSVYEFDPETKTLGNKVYADTEYHVNEIIVIQKHERPKKLPSEVDFGVKTGLLLCQDVNFLDPKSVKNQLVLQKAVAIEIMGADSSMGIVPVEQDGSFYIKIIADQPFQLRTLDENGKVINQACDWMYIRPNERRGCVGCHEDHEQTPENRVPMAVKNLPVNVPVHIEKIKEKEISLE